MYQRGLALNLHKLHEDGNLAERAHLNSLAVTTSPCEVAVASHRATWSWERLRTGEVVNIFDTLLYIDVLLGDAWCC